MIFLPTLGIQILKILLLLDLNWWSTLVLWLLSLLVPATCHTNLIKVTIHTYYPLYKFIEKYLIPLAYFVESPSCWCEQVQDYPAPACCSGWSSLTLGLLEHKNSLGSSKKNPPALGASFDSNFCRSSLTWEYNYTNVVIFQYFHYLLFATITIWFLIS